MKKSVAIVGAGRVGQSLARGLRRDGFAIGIVVCRTPAKARAAVRFIGGGRPQSKLSPEIMESDIVLLAVPDDQIGTVAKALSKLPGDWRGRSVFHTSGALGSQTLSPLRRRGASVGSIHPVYTFPQPLKRIPDRIVFGVEGPPQAVRGAARLARALGGMPVTIRARDKALYHASAAMVAGHLMTLLDLGVRMLSRSGVARKRARATLLPLTERTIREYARQGERAWTGPLERGDVETARKHLRALRRLPPIYREAYLSLGRAAVELYSTRGKRTSRAGLRKLLGDPR